MGIIDEIALQRIDSFYLSLEDKVYGELFELLTR